MEMLNHQLYSQSLLGQGIKAKNINPQEIDNEQETSLLRGMKFSENDHTPNASTLTSSDTIAAAYICLYLSENRPIYKLIENNFKDNDKIQGAENWRPCTKDEVINLGQSYNFRPSDFRNKFFGFDSWLFKLKDQNKYIMATDGTNFKFDRSNLYDSVVDIVQDISQGVLLGLSAQHTLSVHLAKKLDKAIGEDVLWFVGHSLGGGLAANNSLATGRHAITFNAAGLNIARVKLSVALNNPSCLGNIGHMVRNERIHSFVLEGEILNRWISTPLFGLGAYGKRGLDGNTDFIKSIKTVGLSTGKKHCMESIIEEIEFRMFVERLRRHLKNKD